MCGILATTRGIEDLPNVIEFLRFRGPDQTNLVNVNGINFVHTLLSMTGPPTIQPFLSEDKKVVAIDPNMSDLIFCVDSDQKNQTQFRYSQNQRRKETKVKRYRNILQELKTNTIIDERRVEEWEAQMSSFNKKTLDFNMFKVYIKHKNELNKRLAPFYNR